MNAPMLPPDMEPDDLALGRWLEEGGPDLPFPGEPWPDLPDVIPTWDEPLPAPPDDLPDLTEFPPLPTPEE